MHHARGLCALTNRPEVADEIQRDIETAAISDAEKAMLRYARKVTLRSQDTTASDIATLRELGWTDQAILDICQVTAYFNYVNRLASGLGVPLEEE